MIIKNHDRRNNSVFKHGIIPSIKLLGSQQVLSMDERSLVVFDFDGTLSRGPTICEVLAESLSRLPRMQEIELLRTRAEITAAREEMAPWHDGMTNSDVAQSLQTVNFAPGLERFFIFKGARCSHCNSVHNMAFCNRVLCGKMEY